MNGLGPTSEQEEDEDESDGEGASLPRRLPLTKQAQPEVAESSSASSGGQHIADALGNAQQKTAKGGFASAMSQHFANALEAEKKKRTGLQSGFFSSESASGSVRPRTTSKPEQKQPTKSNTGQEQGGKGKGKGCHSEMPWLGPSDAELLQRNLQQEQKEILGSEMEDSDEDDDGSLPSLVTGSFHQNLKSRLNQGLFVLRLISTLSLTDGCKALASMAL